MKTLEEYAKLYSRSKQFFDIPEYVDLDEIEVDDLINQLRAIQQRYTDRKLVLMSEVDSECNTVRYTIGYYDLEPIEKYEARVRQGYDCYVYNEVSKMKARMTPAERKAFEIKELEKRLAQLKDNA